MSVTDSKPTFIWPSAPTLVRRAERELNVAPMPSAPDALAHTVDRFAELEAKLFTYETSYIGLHPPGYESGGRLAFARRFFKKVSRRLMWWYVEPRWTVHREMTATLVGFAHESIDLLRAMSAEIAEVRTRVGELEALEHQTSTGQSHELSGLKAEHPPHHDPPPVG